MVKQYLNVERGNRLKPSRFNSRYWILTSLAGKLNKILNGKFEESINILDYGCGNNPYKELFLRKFKEYSGADLPGNNQSDVIINSDGTLPLSNNSFSCVLSNQVLEHVDDPTLYINEAYRVLKKDGKLILSTHGFWQYHPDPNDFWRWTSTGLRKIIEEGGFNVEAIYSILSFPSLSLQLWLDATLYNIPKILRKLYIFPTQLLMEFFDRYRGDRFSENAAVFIVVAKKNNKTVNKPL